MVTRRIISVSYELPANRVWVKTLTLVEGGVPTEDSTELSDTNLTARAVNNARDAWNDDDDVVAELDAVSPLPVFSIVGGQLIRTEDGEDTAVSLESETQIG